MAGDVCGAFKLPPEYLSAEPVITEQYIFIADHSGRLWALEKQTGRPVWRHRPQGIQTFVNGFPAVNGNRLFFGRSSGGPFPGRLYCYEEA